MLVLMYLTIGIKVWHEKKDDWHLHVRPHKGTHICGPIWEEGTADVESQVDMYIY